MVRIQHEGRNTQIQTCFFEKENQQYNPYDPVVVHHDTTDFADSCIQGWYKALYKYTV